MRQKRFKDQVIIVTGGVQGIGKNIAQGFAREGGKAVVCDINKNEGARLERECHKKDWDVHFLCCDLSKKQAASAMIRRVVRKFGHIDVLINNAHSAKGATSSRETEESWDKGMSVTLKAAFFASQEAIFYMAQKGKGNIVNISSISGKFVCHQSPVYHIAKAGMIHMTRYFAVKAGEHGIRVNAVLPGFIVKNEHQDRFMEDGNSSYRQDAQMSHPLGRVGSSDEVTNAVLFLSSSDASFITGQSLFVDGGATLQEQFALIQKIRKCDKR